MKSLEQQIIDTWFINHRSNIMLMDALTEEALCFTTTRRGGGSVGHQLAHIYNVRFWKLEKCDKSLVKELTTSRRCKELTYVKGLPYPISGINRQTIGKGNRKWWQHRRL